MTDIRVDGGAIVYRLYDIGYSIALDRAEDALTGTARERVRPARFEARAIEIRNPPLFVELGARPVTIGGRPVTAALAVHLFDFGVCSLLLRIPAERGLHWAAFADFGGAVASAQDVAAVFDRELATLRQRVAPAVERPAVAPLVEEYIVFRVDRFEGREGRPAAECLTDDQLAALLLGERRALSATARRELLPHRLAYYDDDLAVLTWDHALVIEPRPDDHDVEYVVEFANAQLLELRMFDGQLDARLPALHARVAAARAGPRLIGARFRTVLSDLQTHVADVTETVERVDNALKVTDDVYLARVYAAALELFREQAWRRGIDRKLGILRETYAMLNDEAQAARAELLEASIVALIVFEIVLSFIRGA